MTATYYSLFIPTIIGGFCQFPSMFKGSLIHLKWHGDLLYRLHWSQLSKRAALCGESDPPDLPSSLLHWKPSQSMSIAWPHSCTVCKGRRVHLSAITTDSHIPSQLHFRSRGERSRGAHYCGWGKFSWNGRGDGKRSPLTLIWANNTAPAPYEHPHRKMFSTWQSRPACLWEETVN